MAEEVVAYSIVMSDFGVVVSFKTEEEAKHWMEVNKDACDEYTWIQKIVVSH